MKIELDTDVLGNKIKVAALAAKEKFKKLLEPKIDYPLSDDEIEYLKGFVKDSFSHEKDEHVIQMYGSPFWTTTVQDTGWDLAIVVYTTLNGSEEYFEQVVPEEFINTPLSKQAYSIMMKLAARKGKQPLMIKRVSRTTGV